PSSPRNLKDDQSATGRHEAHVCQINQSPKTFHQQSSNETGAVPVAPNNRPAAPSLLPATDHEQESPSNPTKPRPRRSASPRGAPSSADPLSASTCRSPDRSCLSLCSAATSHERRTAAGSNSRPRSPCRCSFPATP